MSNNNRLATVSDQEIIHIIDSAILKVVYETNTAQVCRIVKDIIHNSGLELEVVCDETNNTPFIIDNNDLVVEVRFHRPGHQHPTYITRNARELVR